MFGPRPADLAIRPLLLEDAATVIDLMRSQEFAEEHSRETLSNLFDFHWDADREDRGFALTVEGRIVGFLLMVHSRRVIEGQVHRVTNLGSWYVAPEFRLYSMLLPKAAIGIKDHTLVTFTANPRAASVLETIGFQVLSRNRLLFRAPSVLRRSLFRKGRIHDRPDAIRGFLSPEHRRILDDHLRYSCSHYVIQDSDRYCYLVTKRRRLGGEWIAPRRLPLPGRIRRRRWPVSEVLYVSDPEIFLRHRPRVQARIMRRESSIGLTVEESILGVEAPDAVPIPHSVHAIARGMPPRGIDALYSELVLLPI